MAEPQIRYDEPSDTLYLSFRPGERATGIELHENILLRVDKRERAAVGLTLFNYTVLAQETDIGPRSFPLTGLAGLPPEQRQMVLAILQAPPVRDYLVLSAYTPDSSEAIPITSLRAEIITSPAA